MKFTSTFQGSKSLLGLFNIIDNWKIRVNFICKCFIHKKYQSVKFFGKYIDRLLFASSLKKDWWNNETKFWMDICNSNCFFRNFTESIYKSICFDFFPCSHFLTASLVTAVKKVVCDLPDLTFFPSIHRTPKRTFEISREFIHVWEGAAYTEHVRCVHPGQHAQL